MSPGILGKKIGMTQVFRADGQVVPVTVLKAGPCVVVQRKTPTSDGYDAVQLGLMEYIKKTSINKPEAGHLKKSAAEGVKFMREFRLEEGSNGDLKPAGQLRISFRNDLEGLRLRGIGAPRQDEVLQEFRLHERQTRERFRKIPSLKMGLDKPG